METSVKPYFNQIKSELGRYQNLPSQIPFPSWIQPTQWEMIWQFVGQKAKIFENNCRRVSFNCDYSFND